MYERKIIMGKKVYFKEIILVYCHHCGQKTEAVLPSTFAEKARCLNCGSWVERETGEKLAKTKTKVA